MEVHSPILEFVILNHVNTWLLLICTNYTNSIAEVQMFYSYFFGECLSKPL